MVELLSFRVPPSRGPLQLRAFLEAQHAYERARALRHVFVTALLVASGALWFVAAAPGLPTDSPLRWFVLGTWLGLLALALCAGAVEVFWLRRRNLAAARGLR